MMFGRRIKFHNPLVEALPEPCFVFSENGRYAYGNRAAQDMLKILGYGQEKKPENHDAFVQVLRFYGIGADSTATELTLGSARYVLDSRVFDGELLLRLVPIQENEHMQRLSSTLDIVPWGLMTLGLQTDRPLIVHCNRRAGELLQVDHTKLVGLYAADVLRVFGITEDLSNFMYGKDIVHYDHESRTDGKVCWYRLHFIPYAMKRPYCLIVIEDTTENKIMEGQYFQAQRLEALGQLAGGVAHDFNNLLSIIDGYARLARKSVAQDHTAYKYMEHIAQAVQRGSALTGQLLTFGRHKVIKDSVIDLGELVQDQEPLIRPLMDASIALSFKAEKDVYVQVAADNICQILLNLCVNARDAMQDGGNLIVEAGTSAHGEAVLRVIDTGCGMPPDVKAKMFDPFFTTKDQGKGTGLGLSMVYGLVKDMKGDIEVVSKVNEGTAISIYLPLSEARPPAHTITEDADGNLHLEGFTALVAEDEPDLLNILSETLEDMGINVLRASNGNEALMMQEDHEGNIDFLLTDVVMPEMNGVKLAELFESVRPESQVMFMSGYPANNLMARVNLPDNAVIMPKPIDIGTLSGMIRTLAKNQGENIKEKWTAITGQWRSANG
jgi:signal transduction histidine kinase/ActR/RegA family two-component response regulator